MKRIDDAVKVRKWVEESGVKRYFDTPDLAFEAFLYEKGELIASPQMKLNYLLFLIEGVVMVYSIMPDGRMIPVDRAEKNAIFGDLEFSTGGKSSFYCEAATDLICLSLSVSRHREKLDRDLTFLHAMLHSYAEKLALFATLDAGTSTLEERVLLYLKYLSPSGELSGMDACAMKLRCSRRQLQRVVEKMCKEGVLCKAGRGRYRLN